MRLHPAHAQHIGKETLGQPVLPQHRLGLLTSLVREHDTLTRPPTPAPRHIYQAVALHAAQYLGHVRRRHAELLSQPRPHNRVALHREVIYSLQVFARDIAHRRHGLALSLVRSDTPREYRRTPKPCQSDVGARRAVYAAVPAEYNAGSVRDFVRRQ